MTVLVTIVVVGALAVVYDQRAKRHGRRTGVSTQQVEQHQGEVAARSTVAGQEADGSGRPEQG